MTLNVLFHMLNTYLLVLEGNLPFPCVCRAAIAIKPISPGNSNINLPIRKRKHPMLISWNTKLHSWKFRLKYQVIFYINIALPVIHFQLPFILGQKALGLLKKNPKLQNDNVKHCYIHYTTKKSYSHSWVKVPSDNIHFLFLHVFLECLFFAYHYLQ